MNIVLIGYRGTGKSEVAKKLALTLSWPVSSTDELIVKRVSKTIPEIVENIGWAGFRDLESRIVKEVSSCDRQIIDTGGGAILRPENLKALKRNGILVWLKASVETIQKRIYGDHERPSLTGGKSFIQEVREVLAHRTPLYEKAADFQIDTDTQTITVLSYSILRWMMDNDHISQEDLIHDKDLPLG